MPQFDRFNIRAEADDAWVPRVTLEHWHSKANENNLLPAERYNVTRGTHGKYILALPRLDAGRRLR